MRTLLILITLFSTTAYAGDSGNLEKIFEAVSEYDWKKAYKAFENTHCLISSDDTCELEYDDEFDQTGTIQRKKLGEMIRQLESWTKICDAIDWKGLATASVHKLDSVELKRCYEKDEDFVKQVKLMADVDLTEFAEKYTKLYAEAMKARAEKEAEDEKKEEDFQKEKQDYEASAESTSGKLCKVNNYRVIVERSIAREKEAGKESGVVNKAALNKAGHELVFAKEQIAKLKAEYKKRSGGKIWTDADCE